MRLKRLGFLVNLLVFSLAAAETPPVLATYSALPLSFDASTAGSYSARTNGYVIGIDSEGFSFGNGKDGLFKLTFVGGSTSKLIARGELPGKVNYILGKDPQKWRIGVSTFRQIECADLYPGITAVYYGNGNQLEFDLVLTPGADVSRVRMRIQKPARGARVEPISASDGSLTFGDLNLKPPTVLQGATQIAARYRILASGEIEFALADYDHSKQLTIDPVLTYSTLLGGGNSSNLARAVAVDAAGNAYVTGVTYSSDFPTVNAALGAFQSNGDGFISKINPSGTALVYSTYLGGSSLDQLNGIAVDSFGAAWAVGSTNSSDFPLLAPFQKSLSGTQDAIVVKLSPTGSLVFSSYLGGPNGTSASAVAVDGSSNAIVTGYATSGFPTTPNAFQTVNQGGEDAFVTKFNSSGNLIYSTFLGGNSTDTASGVAADSAGNAYVTGFSYSPIFPGAPSGGAQPVNKGQGDVFVAKVLPDGSGLSYFTFFGGSYNDYGFGIGVDNAGNAYVGGYTHSQDLPVSPGAIQPAPAGNYDGFVFKLNAAGSAVLYSTYLGGNRFDQITALTADSAGNVYLSGLTQSNVFPTSAAIQPVFPGNSTSLFATSNGGVSWTPLDSTFPDVAYSISPDPQAPGTLVVDGTYLGTFRSTDAGGSWNVTTGSAQTVTRSPVNPTILYGGSGTSVYQSTTSGLNWTFKGVFPQCCVSQILADPVFPLVVYVPTSTGTVLKSVDGGASWNSAASGIPANALVSSMAAGSDGAIYAGLTGGLISPPGVYKSTNQGASWSSVSVGLSSTIAVPSKGLTVAPSNPQILYVSDYFYLYRSTNGGATWSYVGPLPGGTNVIAVSSSNPSLLYYGAYDSTSPLWYSTNAGVTWNPSSGLGNASISSLSVSPSNSQIAYAVASVNELPFAAKLDPSGHPVYATYLSDAGYGYGVGANGSGDAWVVGYSYSSAFPVTPGALQGNRTNGGAFVTRISDSTPACSYSVDPLSTLEIWYTHYVQFTVTAPAGCSWSAASNQPWATVVSGANGTGTGSVYVLADNTSVTQTATLTIAGQSIALTQRSGSCGYDQFNPGTATVPAVGGTVTFSVAAGSGCQWAIANNDPTAITLVSGSSGIGPGTVVLDVGPNLSPSTRVFQVGEHPNSGSETISQAGTAVPTVTALITSSPAGAVVTVSGVGCIPGSYSTPASLTWNKTSNCTVAFAGLQTLAGAQYVYGSTSLDSGSASGANPLTVNAPSSNVFINAIFFPATVNLSPAQGVNSAQLSVQLSGSPLLIGAQLKLVSSGVPDIPGVLTATLSPSTISETFNLTGASPGPRDLIITNGTTVVTEPAAFSVISAASCTYSVAPSTLSFSATGGPATVIVTPSASGCPWSISTLTKNASWFSVQPPLLIPLCGNLPSCSGGPSEFIVTAAANTTSASRTGTISTVGQTVTVNQSGPCTYSISSSGYVFPSSGGNYPVGITAPGGCPWTVSTPAWITASPSSGSGSGTVILTAMPNTGSLLSNSLTIAGKGFLASESAPACGATDVSDKVSVSQGALLPASPVNTALYDRQITLTNSSGVIPGPIYLVIDGLPNSTLPGCSSVNGGQCGLEPAAPLTHCLSPNGSSLVLWRNSALAARESSTAGFTFYLGRSALSLEGYKTRVFSGTPNQ